MIDAFPLVHRAFHAQRQEQERDAAEALAKNEELPPRRAIEQFLQTICQLRRTFPKTTHMCVVCDHPTPSFRKQLVTSYKQHRPPLHELLRPQLPLIGQAAESLGIKSCSVSGYEADDVLVSLARAFASETTAATIISPDKDLMQALQWTNVKIYDWSSKSRRTVDDCISKFGVQPRLIHEAQALSGDSSDGYKGIKGIGPKRAAELLNNYGSIERIYENLAQLPDTLRKPLEQGRSELDNSVLLATLVSTVPLPVQLEQLALQPDDPDQIQRFCIEQQLPTFFDWWQNQGARNRSAAPPPS